MAAHCEARSRELSAPLGRGRAPCVVICIDRLTMRYTPEFVTYVRADVALLFAALPWIAVLAVVWWRAVKRTRRERERQC